MISPGLLCPSLPVDARPKVLKEFHSPLREDNFGFQREATGQGPVKATHSVALVLPDVGTKLHLQKVGIELCVVLQGRDKGGGGQKTKKRESKKVMSQYLGEYFHSALSK